MGGGGTQHGLLQEQLRSRGGVQENADWSVVVLTIQTAPINRVIVRGPVASISMATWEWGGKRARKKESQRERERETLEMCFGLAGKNVQINNEDDFSVVCYKS